MTDCQLVTKSPASVQTNLSTKNVQFPPLQFVNPILNFTLQQLDLWRLLQQ